MEKVNIFIDDCIRRLSKNNYEIVDGIKAMKEDSLFPLAGQEFRNNIILMFEELKKEQETGGICMKFIFESKTELDESTYKKIVAILCGIETQLNTVFPHTRFHLKEEK